MKVGHMKPTKLLHWIDAPIILSFGTYVCSYITSRGLWCIRSILGIGIAVVAFALWWLAHIQLGESFAIKAEARSLVTTGLYSRIRHPIYFFGGLGYLGLFVAWGKWIPLLLFVSIYSTQLFRVRKEESVLQQAFGEDYHRYRAGTWF
jgi:protein-S-isoprenylcysteine O-methyltransferase Ste14